MEAKEDGLSLDLWDVWESLYQSFCFKELCIKINEKLHPLCAASENITRGKENGKLNCRSQRTHLLC